MRNDFVNVETAELSDGELDGVAGGIGALGLNVTGANSVVSTAMGLADGFVPASQIVGTVAPGLAGLTGTAGFSATGGASVSAS